MQLVWLWFYKTHTRETEFTWLTHCSVFEHLLGGKVSLPCDFLAATKTSFCPSVCLSVCHLFHYVPVIVSSWNFQWQNYYQWQNAKGQGHRWKVKVTEVITQLSRFRTVTPVWIHMWWWNDAQSLMLLRRGALMFSKVIRQISRSHGTKKSPILTRIESIRTVTLVWIHQWLWNDAQSLKKHRRGALLFFEVIHQISRSHAIKKSPILTQIKRFRAVTPFWIYQWFWNYAQSLMQHRRGALLFFNVIHQISRSHRTKNRRFWPELSVFGQ